MMKVEHRILLPTASVADVLTDPWGCTFLPSSVGPRVAGFLLDHWLGQERLTCCSFQGGLALEIEDEPWSGIDELSMTANWLRALAQIAGGEASASTYVWEESHLRIERDGELLAMEDSGFPRVTVPARPFAARIAAEMRAFFRIAETILAEAAARHPKVGPRVGPRPDVMTLENKVEELLQQVNSGIDWPAWETVDRFSWDARPAPWTRDQVLADLDRLLATMPSEARPTRIGARAPLPLALAAHEHFPDRAVAFLSELEHADL